MKFSWKQLIYHITQQPLLFITNLTFSVLWYSNTDKFFFFSIYFRLRTNNHTHTNTCVYMYVYVYACTHTYILCICKLVSYLRLVKLSEIKIGQLVLAWYVNHLLQTWIRSNQLLLMSHNETHFSTLLLCWAKSPG